MGSTIAGASGCGGDDTTPPAAKTGSVVFGLNGELRPGVEMDAMHVVTRAGTAVVEDKTLQGSALAYPLELKVSDQPDGTVVSAQLDPTKGGAPLLTRLASTRVVAGRNLLVEMALQFACISEPAGSMGPHCDAPETCVGGVCRDSFVDPKGLPDYTDDWGRNDPCKPSGSGAPDVAVGQGQADYLPMKDGDVAQIEAGPQGGYHIWLAIRQKGLLQSGSITEVGGRVAALGYDVPTFKVIFTFDQDEGGYCKLPGLRFRLDSDAHPIEDLFGQTLDIEVKVTDKDDSVGTGKRTVVLSDGFI